MKQWHVIQRNNAAVTTQNNIKELKALPELCRFYNIIIKMIYSDNGQHHKPHFHVYYAEYEASVGVDGELLAGSLPVKQLKLVQAWATIHEDSFSIIYLLFMHKIPVLYRRIMWVINKLQTNLIDIRKKV